MSIAERVRVLIVDDDAGVRAFVRDALERNGYVTLEASDGEEALKIARRVELEAAIIDVVLPGISGYEVCRSLQAGSRTSPRVLFISGERTDALDRAAGIYLGGDDYLVKPFAAEELIARLKRLLRATSPGNQNQRNGTPLSRRELEILHLLASGMRQNEIAAKLVVSPKTVASHIRNLLDKLGARNPPQAVAEAIHRRLLD
jgi:DNA-binding NarL/FixJ family response regulator